MDTIIFSTVYVAALALSLFVLGVLTYVVWRTIRAGIQHNVRLPRTRLIKPEHNPILEPHCTNVWEQEATFNPAALYLENRIHLLYRALGPDGASRIGYAQGADGICFPTRLPYPIFTYYGDKPQTHRARDYHPGLYKSGGGWGGAEDPRAVCIDDTIYLTFSAFANWDSLRIGMASIKKDHFLRMWWNWSKVTYLSPQGEVHKNWVLFPERIDGKIALLTSITPHIQITYADTPEALSTMNIQSTFEQRRNWGPWEGNVRGVGPPPLKTTHGWLVLYHANAKQNPEQYHLGALLLDLKDPTRILAHSKTPILSPHAWYENQGKPGIVYATGAIIKDGTLFVYYGGGDRVVCVGSAPLTEFLHDLTHAHYALLNPAPLTTRDQPCTP